MALVASYLVDTSAAARMQHPGVSQRIAPLIAAGLVGTTAGLDAEALYSARTPVEYEQRWAVRRDTYEYLPTEDEHWHTALGAQRDLARIGMHPSVGITDLLTAALAAAHNLTVVHYDADFDIAATVLVFQHQWVMPRGAL